LSAMLFVWCGHGRLHWLAPRLAQWVRSGKD
jgi:hypothetical protein